MRPVQISHFIFILLFSSATFADKEDYVELGETYVLGRQIWLETCESCHGYGIAGAPIPMNPKDWKLRVDTPVDQLYTRAINGFFGPGDTYMPPRGGNDQLSDTEVILAVDYKVALATYYINQKEDKQ